MSLPAVYLLAALAGLALGGCATVVSHYLPLHLRRAWRGRSEQLSLPLLWAGLLVNLDGVLTPLPHAVLGAVVGYGVLWIFYHVFKWFTGREGMGFGDFKLTAALGAWLGVGELAPLLLLAAVAGLVVGVAGRLRGGPDRPQPFAPFLALAGIMALMWPPHWNGFF